LLQNQWVALSTSRGGNMVARGRAALAIFDHDGQNNLASFNDLFQRSFRDAQLSGEAKGVPCTLHDGTAGRRIATHEEGYTKNSFVAHDRDFRRCAIR
jgi:hypothetical protein